MIDEAIDMDESARLILMDIRQDPEIRAGRKSGLGLFIQAMRAEYPDFSLLDAQPLYTKYMGFDGRVRPTHDIDTGRPLGRR